MSSVLCPALFTASHTFTHHYLTNMTLLLRVSVVLLSEAQDILQSGAILSLLALIIVGCVHHHASMSPAVSFLRLPVGVAEVTKFKSPTEGF